MSIRRLARIIEFLICGCERTSTRHPWWVPSSSSDG